MRPRRRAFTLIELLVVIAILALIVSILIPSLVAARNQAKGAVCLTRLRTLGQGLHLYANDYADALPPGRMPQVDNDQIRVRIAGGIKYRPTFLAMMAFSLGLPTFEDPQASRSTNDRFGEPGDRQNYSEAAYLCPEVPDWRDERNGAFGYNYQFLGNSRLRFVDDPSSYKNWPVKLASIRTPASCAAVADSMGTAASFARNNRRPYEDNEPGNSRTGRSTNAYGNEGFNLDPPKIDLANGEAAGLEEEIRTAPHERHNKKANVLWLDGHGSAASLLTLGYEVDPEGIVTFEGRNRLFSRTGSDDAWLDEP